MKSSFWHIQINREDKCKTTFTVHFSEYEWNVIPFGLKIFSFQVSKNYQWYFQSLTKFIIVYIDDVLIDFESLKQHFKHLNIFIHKRNNLAVSEKEIVLCQTRKRFLRHHINLGTLAPIQRNLEFVEKFSDKIQDKNSLRCFLGCVNYIADFVNNIRLLCAHLFKGRKSIHYLGVTSTF